MREFLEIISWLKICFFDLIVSLSFNWFAFRSRDNRKNWNEWMLCPVINSFG